MLKHERNALLKHCPKEKRQEKYDASGSLYLPNHTASETFFEITVTITISLLL